MNLRVACEDDLGTSHCGCKRHAWAKRCEPASFGLADPITLRSRERWAAPG